MERDRGFELGTTEKQFPLVAGWRPCTRQDLELNIMPRTPFYFVIFIELNWCEITCLVSQDKKRQTSLGQIGLPQSGNLPGSLFAELGMLALCPAVRRNCLVFHIVCCIPPNLI